MGSAAWCFSSLPIPAVHAVGGAEPFPCRWTARPTARRTPTATSRRSSPQNCTGEKMQQLLRRSLCNGSRNTTAGKAAAVSGSADAQQTQDQTVLAALRMGPEHTQRPGQALAGNAGVADGLPISADSGSQPGQFRPGLRNLTMRIMHHQTFPFLRLVNAPRSSPTAAENSQMTMTKRLAPRPL